MSYKVLITTRVTQRLGVSAIAAAVSTQVVEFDTPEEGQTVCQIINHPGNVNRKSNELGQMEQNAVMLYSQEYRGLPGMPR